MFWVGNPQNPKKSTERLVFRENLWKTIPSLWKTFGKSVDNLWKKYKQN